MGIEIRQLVVKSNVVQGQSDTRSPAKAGKPEAVSSISGCELDAIKEDVMKECQEWLRYRQGEFGER